MTASYFVVVGFCVFCHKVLSLVLCRTPKTARSFDEKRDSSSRE